MEIDYNLQHLLAELDRIAVLFRRCVVQRQEGSSMGGLVVTEEDLAFLFAQDEPSSLDGEAEAELQRDYAQRVARAQATQTEAEQAQQLPRFAALCDAFQLSAFERNVLLICLAPIIDPRYSPLFGYLQNDITVRRPTVFTVLEVLAASPVERLQLMPAFLARGRLFHHRLLQRVQEEGAASALPAQQLFVDECVVAWLLGHYHPDPRLEACVTLEYPQAGAEEELLTSEIWDAIAASINGQTLALFHGSDLAVQRAAARLLALNTGMPLLRVDLAAVQDLDVRELLRLVLRDARMTSSALLLEGWDAVAGQNLPPTALLKILFETTVPTMISSEKEWYAHGVERTDAILRVTFPKPSYRQRRALWRHFVENAGYETAADLNLQGLASQFTLDSQQIKDAVASARDMALQRGDAIGQSDLVTAARVHSSPNLAGLARKIEPRYAWEDIVLPDDQKAMLRELIQTVKGRGMVMEAWGVGKKLKTSSGVTVLFAGPPGTGKTMSAEVVAGELGLDLYKIDLSTVVSKYIGETEKNLGKIFDEAQSSSAVLFFDEADAIFGKRSEVKDSHDRYANMEISYLLQRMEMYDGVTILATNLRANMDEAFTRRMQFIVDFPFPDVEERLHIWQTLFPADLPRSSDIDLALFADRFKLAGGNIRNVIASAAFLAAANGGVVTMDHLLHSTRRELQKMGRLISDVDLTY